MPKSLSVVISHFLEEEVGKPPSEQINIYLAIDQGLRCIKGEGEKERQRGRKGAGGRGGGGRRRRERKREKGGEEGTCIV